MRSFSSSEFAHNPPREGPVSLSGRHSFAKLTWKGKCKKLPLLQPRNACRNAIKRALLHISNPADTLLSTTPPLLILPPLYCLSALLSAFGPDASLLLLFFLRLIFLLLFVVSVTPTTRERMEEETLASTFFCLFVHSTLLFFQNPILTFHHTSTGGKGVKAGGGVSKPDLSVLGSSFITSIHHIKHAPQWPPSRRTLVFAPPYAHQVDRQKFSSSLRSALTSLSLSVSASLLPFHSLVCLHAEAVGAQLCFPVGQPSANASASISERGDDNHGHHGHTHPSIHKVDPRTARTDGLGWIVRVKIDFLVWMWRKKSWNTHAHTLTNAHKIALEEKSVYQNLPAVICFIQGWLTILVHLGSRSNLFIYLFFGRTGTRSALNILSFLLPV